MKKIKLKTIILIISLSSSLYADDAKVPCFNKDGSLGLNSLESYNCKIASTLSFDPKVQAQFKDFVDKKLALSLNQKSSELVEDLALLDSYFDQNGIDLGENEDVRNHCQFQVMAEPSCEDDVPKKLVNKKLSFLNASDNFLPRELNGDNSLYKRLFLKANQVRSANKLKEANKCPVDGDSGNFILASQFTTSDAKTLLGYIKKGDLENDVLNEMYKNYPQLKMLVNGEDNSLKLKFEHALKNIPDDGNEKKFIDSFFKEKTTQDAMAKSVVSKCKDFKASVHKFACRDDYPHLAMKEEDRYYFFYDTTKNPDNTIFREVSRGLSCEMEEKFKKDSGKDPFVGAGTIISKIEYYKKDLREPEATNVVNEKLGPFCALYLCKSTEITPEMLSCKNGGPISSRDILTLCPKNKDNKPICSDKFQKYISYLNQLERDAINSGVMPNTIAGKGNSNDTVIGGTSEKPRGFTSFYQNLLGVEGTIAAEGKKITPITIAEKKAEFVEKKLDVSTNTASLSQSREGMKVESVRQESIIPVIESSEIIDTAANTRESDQYRRSFQSTQFSKTNYELGKDANGKAKKVKFTDTDSSTLDEMKKLRGELADALGKVKGTDEERLATIADSNAVAITPKGSSVNPIKNLSSAEKDRLDSYRDSLNNWEDRLRSWQNNLSDRDVRANSGTGSTSDARPVAAPAVNDDQFNSDNGSAGGVRLTKTSAGASAVAGAKGDVAGERAPGTEKVEAETGVVNSENLATLGKESLKELGITATDSFIIKVRHKEKIYSVPVKTLTHGGKSMFVPLLNEKDPELSKIVYESPLFKDYRAYQIERQYKLEKK